MDEEVGRANSGGTGAAASPEADTSWRKKIKSHKKNSTLVKLKPFSNQNSTYMAHLYQSTDVATCMENRVFTYSYIPPCTNMAYCKL